MKSIAQVQELLMKFQKQHGLDLGPCEQQSEMWFKAKLGVVSASNVSKAIAKKESQTRLSYMCALVAQICTGLQEEIKATALDWGNQYEDAARAYYEFQSGFTITKVPFVFMDENFREGSSPDGFVNAERGCEIKCPFNSANFIEFLAEDGIDSAWRWQAQHNMRVTGANEWDFGMYDPRMKNKMLKFVTIERDEKAQKTMADAIPQFLYDMDQMLAKVGATFGQQWKPPGRVGKAEAGGADASPVTV